MTFHTDAIYENGVLRPLVPLDLQEHEVVSLSIYSAADKGAPEADAARQRSVLAAYVAKVESRPDDTPQDSLTNRDHDLLIYGKSR
jgi:predicted DNA-binding antitoxin AbrB/MazE fold protein